MNRIVPISGQPYQKSVAAETRVDDAEHGRIRAVLSTESVDRHGDIIRQSGWEKLDQFMKHPVLLAGHNYYNISAQIGEWEDVRVRSKQLEAVARYYIGESNEEADWGYKVAAKGRAAYSVGFMPLEWKEREAKDDDDDDEKPHHRRGYEFIRQELLEASHVSIPANPDALQRMMHAGVVAPEMLEIAFSILPSGLTIPSYHADSLTTTDVIKAGRVMSQANLDRLHGVMESLEIIHKAVCDMGEECPMKGMDGALILLGAVPTHNPPKADEDESWSAPTLSDFTDGSWDDLSAERRRWIMEHFAWSENVPPEKYGDLKLPHHSVQATRTVWRGVAAAMAALMGARGGVNIPDGDRKATYNHLAAHYRQFDKEPPEFREAERESTPEPERTTFMESIFVGLEEALKDVEEVHT